MEKVELRNIVQAIIQASPKPVTLEELCQVFTEDKVDTTDITDAIETLLKMNDPVQELKPIAGGYRFHLKSQYVPWIQRAQDPEERADPLPRASLETLAIIAYKQPVSRGEVDLIRGKQTSVFVYQELEEREWIKIVAYGGESKRAALYGTTIMFLEYFGLNSIHDLPNLEEKMALEATTL
jgi:segregation and condensation protein B